MDPCLLMIHPMMQTKDSLWNLMVKCIIGQLELQWLCVMWCLSISSILVQIFPSCLQRIKPNGGLCGWVRTSTKFIFTWSSKIFFWYKFHESDDAQENILCCWIFINEMLFFPKWRKKLLQFFLQDKKTAA